MRALGFDATKEEAKALAEKIASTNKDGRVSVSFDAFLEVMSERIANRDPKEEITKAFALFDEDNTGKINLKTLKKIAKDLGETMTDQELEEMIVEADTDGDGEVTLEDFIKIMQATNIF